MMKKVLLIGLLVLVCGCSSPTVTKGPTYSEWRKKLPKPSANDSKWNEFKTREKAYAVLGKPSQIISLDSDKEEWVYKFKDGSVASIQMMDNPGYYIMWMGEVKYINNSP